MRWTPSFAVVASLLRVHHLESAACTVEADGVAFRLLSLVLSPSNACAVANALSARRCAGLF